MFLFGIAVNPKCIRYEKLFFSTGFNQLASFQVAFAAHFAPRLGPAWDNKPPSHHRWLRRWFLWTRPRHSHATQESQTDHGHPRNGSHWYQPMVCLKMWKHFRVYPWLNWSEFNFITCPDFLIDVLIQKRMSWPGPVSLGHFFKSSEIWSSLVMAWPPIATPTPGGATMPRRCSVATRGTSLKSHWRRCRVFWRHHSPTWICLGFFNVL